MSDLDKLLGEQRARQRGEQRVLVLVHGVCGDGLSQELIGELVAQVEHLAIENAQVKRFCFLASKPVSSWPTLPQTQTTSRFFSSWSHLTHTDVSRPPEYARTTFFLAHGCFLSPLVAS